MSLRQDCRLLRCSILSFLCLLSIPSGITQAQIVPDDTLGTESSVINSTNKLRERIEGGATQGNNLFHSFQEFNIGEGLEVYFANPEGIANIFSRVTGNNISEILGTLGVEGTANLFLINPNGIVFGENAVIDVGGAFIATTANRIDFNDGTSFTVRDENQKPILTWNAPIGLGLDGNNGSITVNGIGNQIVSESAVLPIEFEQRPTGLSVKDGNTLALVSNGINFNGGVVTTEGGNIDLTSIEYGSVGINPSGNGLTLIDHDVTKYQDINLNQQSLIDSSGEKVGNISLTGQNINFFNTSFVLAQNQGNLTAGSISIKAFETLTVSGRSPLSNVRTNIRSETLNTGEGANINIEANQLILQDGARIRSNSFSDGNAGNINVNISDAIKLLQPSSIITSTFAQGNAGNISLSTSQLSLSAAGIVSSTFGTGDGGNIDINADLIELAGTTSLNRSSISASSFSNNQNNPGDAGSININTANLRLIDGASLSSSSFGTGNAGDIIINASESAEVQGKSETFVGSNSPQSTIRSAVQAASPSGQAAYGLPEIPTGNAGSLTINTPSLKVSQEGTLSVENQGTGSAGTLEIIADNLNLDEAGRITAVSASGQGGNIELNTDELRLIDNSNISTSAEGIGNGGNITIDADTLVAVGDSDITATAVQGNGGNITITSGAILGIEERRATPGNGTSDIDASSEFGEDGTVTISDPQVFIQDPLTLIREVDISKLSRELIEQTCDEGRAKIKDLRHADFYTNPDNFSDQPDFKLSEDFVPPQEEKTQVNSLEELLEHLVVQAKNPQPGDPIVSANQIVTLPNGRRFLVPKGQWEYIKSRCNIPE